MQRSSLTSIIDKLYDLLRYAPAIAFICWSYISNVLRVNWC